MADLRENGAYVAGRDYTRRVVVCGSMTFYGQMCRVQEMLSEQSVRAVLPGAEDHLLGTMTPKEQDAFKRQVSLAHIRRIRSPQTFGILVLNLDKHGISGYIGPSTFAEIAIATVHGKRVFLIGPFPEIYAEELAAWGAVTLDGCLEPLIARYREACARPSRQLSMFVTT
jgi:hypothetical protein